MSTVLCVTAGMAWGCVRGEAALGKGKVLHQRVVGTEQVAHGSGHSAILLESKKHLENTLEH